MGKMANSQTIHIDFLGKSAIDNLAKNHVIFAVLFSINKIDKKS